MEKIKEYMKELKLKRIPDIFREEVKRAAEGDLDYTEYLSKLIEEEYQGMVERSINQRIRSAGFPWVKTIEEFDFTCQPELNDKLIRNLCTIDFLNEATNILLVGPPGTGKTHLAIGLSVKACQKRKRVLFYSAQDLVEELAKAKLTGRLGNELTRMGRLDLLVVDEIGYIDMNRENATLFFQLVSRRYERGSIILTTNRPFEDWNSIFEDSVLATAILDRLLHHSHVFYIIGKSYRMKSIEGTKNRIRKEAWTQEVKVKP